MRYVFGLICVCTLGVVPLVGCADVVEGSGGSGGTAGSGGMAGTGGTGGIAGTGGTGGTGGMAGTGGTGGTAGTGGAGGTAGTGGSGGMAGTGGSAGTGGTGGSAGTGGIGGSGGAAGAGGSGGVQQTEVERLLATAEGAWANRGNQAQAQEAIDAWRMVAGIDPENVEALSALTHALHFYADCYLRFDENDPQLYRDTHEEGIRVAERALRAMSPAFDQKLANGERFEEAIDVLDKFAVPALYWRSLNLDRWGTLESFATWLSYTDETRTVMEFCLAEDSLYWYRGPDRFFGAFYARLPSFAGGDMQKSWAHFNESRDIHPNFFGTRVLMAEEWAVKEGNRALFEELLGYVLSGDPSVIPEIMPENTCEQRKAQALMAEIDNLF